MAYIKTEYSRYINQFSIESVRVEKMPSTDLDMRDKWWYVIVTTSSGEEIECAECVTQDEADELAKNLACFFGGTHIVPISSFLGLGTA